MSEKKIPKEVIIEAIKLVHDTVEKYAAKKNTTKQNIYKKAKDQSYSFLRELERDGINVKELNNGVSIKEKRRVGDTTTNYGNTDKYIQILEKLNAE